MRVGKLVALASLCLLSVGICGESGKVKLSRLSPGWYAQGSDALSEQLADLGRKALLKYPGDTIFGRLRGGIVPHAGYPLSGPIAAGVYQVLKGEIPKRLVIMGPTHHFYFRGAAVPSFSTYRTYLGDLPIDQEAVNRISDKKPFVVDDRLFEEEHSIELQIPFLQKYAPGCKVVPIIVGDISTPSDSRILANILKNILDDSTVVIASSDFTHYGPQFNYVPFQSDPYNRIRMMDGDVLKMIYANDLDGFCKVLKVTGATVCGAKPISVLLALIELGALGSVDPILVGYDTSANIFGGTERVNADGSVSYVGVAWCQSPSVPTEQELTKFDKSELLKSARRTLENAFSKKTNKYHLFAVPSPANSAPLGVFVTLYKIDGNVKSLRGCIGRVFSDEPLYKTVVDMTLSSAFQDSRFSPVKEDEVSKVQIAISVLGKPHRVRGYNEIKIGKHGIILKFRGKSALFLPKVAPDFGWDLPTTLAHLSDKAGLPRDAWKDPGCEFEVFESTDFSE